MRRAAIALLLATVAFPRSIPAQPWSPEDQRNAGRVALAMADSGRMMEAQGLALTADPMVRKLVTWIRLQAKDQATAGELAAWIEANPDWPLPGLMAKRAEEALVNDPDDALALRFFAQHPPRGLEGAQRYADALNRAGRLGEVTPVLRAAWVQAPGDAVAEPGFLARNASVLTPEDHWQRFDRLAYARELGAAARVMPYLDPARRPAASARLALAGDRPEAEALLPAVSTPDLGLLVEQARWLRRRDRDAEAATVWEAAARLQRDLSPEAARAVWTEREVLARKLIRLNEPRAAYRVAAEHGQPGPGAARGEAEFLAGWIALRRLNEPATAHLHFSRVAEGSTSIITRSRAAYWQGRALAAQGDTAGAKAAWNAAASLPTSYYGQLASFTLNESPARLAERIRAAGAAPPPPGQTALFVDRELPRAVLTLADLGLQRRALPFLLRLEELSPDAGTRLLVARLADSTGRPDQAVWVSRRSGIDGVALVPEGWPTPYPTPDGLEPALVRAISRQESNFDPQAVSPSNARGLMQLLPTTAAEVARRNGIPHQFGWLTSDPAHNMKLGSIYLGDQLARFGDNPALAAAAYNAGPRRVAEWLATYGEPGTPGVDMIDWVELIPFSETRNYVQRVIENMVVYRALGGDGAQPHPLARWLAP
ncbi:Soluble lytic murein transglycosylase [Roseomonas mucosa]|uniref:Transglycosylase n=1 Tax=Roseomonas mucosa TaxID=207340 RepID=A0A1S8D9S6_9PROT|nr:MULTISPECIES: lytic transglycosylase domain-containing protein [Roseomonas]MBS5901271.1 lytic transglycosylase domain-containing protein [Acetobacteraceae bacterium]MCG7351131.1 lytic transglycosylase domain-containing protein [Roseomonas mucosa]MCG7355590.1 lytic transglycosylase domain-containing protein [Roseomonas mucosa]MDT8288303.1 lytic transglycosylase domain-containing protein [Roseomonas mucosa]MDT8294447.1 lytic transglycosylase domain-containing protein [Roseomonas mucosa]